MGENKRECGGGEDRRGRGGRGGEERRVVVGGVKLDAKKTNVVD